MRSEIIAGEHGVSTEAVAMATRPIRTNYATLIAFHFFFYPRTPPPYLYFVRVSRVAGFG